MILCVTPNAAIDRSLVVHGYAHGGIFRPSHSVIAAGGKGVNVARAVRILGGDALCMGFVAGHSGRHLLDLLAAESLPADFTVLASGETRTCIMLIDPALPDTTVINENGPTVSAQDWARLHAALLAHDEASTVCLCGSLPPGTPLESFIGTVQANITDGRAVWIDTSGATLAAALHVEGAHVKVNADELGAAVGHAVDTLEALLAAVDSVRQTTRGIVAVTLGARGAVLVTDAGAWQVTPPPIRATSAVGSGDSFLAGLALGHARGQSPEDTLRMAAATGAANALTVGAGRFQADDVARLAQETHIIRLR